MPGIWFFLFFFFFTLLWSYSEWWDCRTKASSVFCLHLEKFSIITFSSKKKTQIIIHYSVKESHLFHPRVGFLMLMLHYSRLPGQLFLSELTGIMLWSTGPIVHAMNRLGGHPINSGHLFMSRTTMKVSKVKAIQNYHSFWKKSLLYSIERCLLLEEQQKVAEYITHFNASLILPIFIQSNALCFQINVSCVV